MKDGRSGQNGKYNQQKTGGRADKKNTGVLLYAFPQCAGIGRNGREEHP